MLELRSGRFRFRLQPIQRDLFIRLPGYPAHVRAGRDTGESRDVVLRRGRRGFYQGCVLYPCSVRIDSLYIIMHRRGRTGRVGLRTTSRTLPQRDDRRNSRYPPSWRPDGFLSPPPWIGYHRPLLPPAFEGIYGEHPGRRRDRQAD